MKGNLSKELETMKNNQKKILELKIQYWKLKKKITGLS